MTYKHSLVLLLLLASSFLAQVPLSLGQVEPTISNGFIWLRNNQSADGSWGEEPTSLTTRFHTTSVVLEAFHYYRINDSAYQRGVQWISSQNVINVDYISRKAEALSKAGMNASNEINQLTDVQNSDGGWGLDRGFPSEVLDTILAVQALSVSLVEGNVLENGVTYVLNRQNGDGGYGLLPEENSTVYYTSLILPILEEYKYATFSKRANNAIRNASAWLASQQQSNGGWIEDGNTVFQNSLATSALRRTGYPFNATGAKSWILAAQKPDASWNSNAYETALALMAIGGPWNHPPHAAFSFTPTTPLQGEVVQFTDASNDPDGTILRQRWDFGDGTTSKLQNPTHTYIQPGTYIVTLSVADNASGIDTATQTIDIALQTLPFGTPPKIGDLFAGVGNGTIKHFDSNGTLIKSLNTTSGSNEETGMTFDAQGNLYTTNFSNRTMTKFNNLGWLIKHPWGGSFYRFPESVVIDAVGNIYVGEVGGVYIWERWWALHKFDPAGNLLATFTPQPENRGIDWIDLAADQSTIFYTSEGYSIKRFDVDSNTQLPDFATLPSSPAYALRIRSNGEVLVAATTAVYRLDSAGNVIQNYTAESVGETSFFFALNLDPDGTSFWTAGYESGNIYRFDIETGDLLTSFNAGILGYSLGGLAIFGEITASRPTPPPTIWSSDADGNPKDEFTQGETVYVTVPATGQTVALYIVTDQTSWSNGNTITDVSDGEKTIILNPGPGNQTIQIWAAPLAIGNYDIIMDVNNNGVFDVGLDLVDSALIAGFSIVSPPPTPYDATINAYCNTEAADVNVAIAMDGSPTGYSTSHTFTGLTGTHTFTVPETDANGHPFKQWSTGEASTTITVNSGGIYTAYYETPPPPPPTYDVTIDAYCNTEDTVVSVGITMDGTPSGYTTPQAFTGLSGTHTFTVPATDANGHAFKQWGTGETTLSITVSSTGTYTAYYEAPPPPPPTYDITVSAYCNTEAATVSVGITMDGNPTGFDTPKTFTGLIGTHTFTVPSTDANEHPFEQWNTGETTTTITVSSAGTYTAYYEAPPPPPPPTYDVTIDAYCNTEATAVNVAITMDGTLTGFNTPRTFTGLTGTHTFTVPSSDANGHPFKQWISGESSATITVSSAGTYTAYYEAPPPPPTYDITVQAYCNTESAYVSVDIAMDGTPSGYTTPKAFTGLTGTHTFTVPATDANGHAFKQWNTEETTTAITVNSEGTYTAYYEAPQPPLANIWSSDSLSNSKDVFVLGETVFATVTATGQRVTLYVVIDQTVWNDGDVLTDVSDGTETLTLNLPPGTQTIQIWAPPLVVGNYDIVMDANTNGVFDAGIDLVDSMLITGFNVIPEVPFGTAITFLSMLIALAGFVGFKRFRPKFRPQ